MDIIRVSYSVLLIKCMNNYKVSASDISTGDRARNARRTEIASFTSKNITLSVLGENVIQETYGCLILWNK